MRKQFGNTLRIGLSKSGVAVILRRGWLQRRCELIAQTRFSESEAASPERVALTLTTLLKESDCPASSASLVLSDNWARRWLVTPPQNASRLADCQAAARVRFNVLFGEAPTDWAMAADWGARQPFLVCAIPQLLLSSLQQVSHDCKLSWVEIAPQFVVAWNRWRGQLHTGTWFGVLHQQMLTIAVAGKPGPVAVRELVLSEQALLHQAQLPKMLAREALRLNLPVPQQINLCGQIPDYWVMQEIDKIKFVRLDTPREAHDPVSAEVELAWTGLKP